MGIRTPEHRSARSGESLAGAAAPALPWWWCQIAPDAMLLRKETTDLHAEHLGKKHNPFICLRLRDQAGAGVAIQCGGECFGAGNQSFATAVRDELDARFDFGEH